MINLVLYAPRIPQNVGQLARTCLAMHCRLHLIRPLGFRLDAPGLRRAAVGYLKLGGELDLETTAITAGDWVIHADGEAFWASLRPPARGWLITRRGRLSHLEAPFQIGDYLILGNETEGLPPEWLDARPDQTVAIPMLNPRVRCLNLAAAGTVVLFEALRRVGALNGMCSGAAASGRAPANSAAERVIGGRTADGCSSEIVEKPAGWD